MTVRQLINALLSFDNIDVEIDVTVDSDKYKIFLEMKEPRFLLYGNSDENAEIIIEGD